MLSSRPSPTFRNWRDIRDAALTQALTAKLCQQDQTFLGRLEDLSLQMGQILGSEEPVLEQPQMVVFCSRSRNNAAAWSVSQRRHLADG